MKSPFAVALLCAALVAFVSMPCRAEEQLEVIRIAISGAGPGGRNVESGNALLTLLRQRALEQAFESERIRIEWSYFPNGAATTEAIVANRVDFAQQGDIGAIAGRASGVRHRLLLTLNRFSSSYIIVRADSPAHSLADLRGKRLGTVRGANGDLVLRRILEEQGFSESDFEIVNITGGAAAVQAARVAGEIDAHYASNPFEQESNGVVRIVYRSRRDLDVSGLAVFVVSADFEERHSAIVQRLVDALVAAASWSSDPKNRDPVFRLWTLSDSERAGVARRWDGLELKNGLSPLFDDYALARLRRTSAEAKRFGFIAGDVSLDGWAAPSYLHSALERARLDHFWPWFDADGKSGTTFIKSVRIPEQH